MTRSTKQKLTSLTSIGIDIGKNTFHLVGFDGLGKIALRRKIKRLSLVSEFKKLPRCIVGMEACLSAHFVSRTLRGLGFEPRIMPAKYTKPFLKGQKNDYNDAEAIAEAALRPNLRCVREKTQDQLDLQALHRVRFRTGLAADGDDQPDPRLSHRTRHRGSHRCPFASQVVVPHSAEPRGRDITTDERHHRRALRRLVVVG